MGSSSSRVCVANAYNETIWAQVAIDRQYLLESSFSVSTNLAGEGAQKQGEHNEKSGKGSAQVDVSLVKKYFYDLVDKKGFTRIVPNGYQMFDVEGKCDPRVYISLFSDSGLLIASAMPKENGSNIIVKPNRQICDAMEDSIWEDTKGKTHKAQVNVYVANAFTEAILVKVNTDYNRMTEDVDGIREKIEKSDGKLAKENCSFTKIEPNNKEQFCVYNEDGDNIYFGILTLSGQPIDKCLPKPNFTNIIITNDGKIRDAKHGKIWVDTDRHNHKKNLEVQKTWFQEYFKANDNMAAEWHETDVAQVYFNEFDSDGDGKISYDELKALVEKSGYKLTEDEIKALIAEADADASGGVTLKEFTSAVSKLPRWERLVVRMKRLFEAMSNGFGFITKENLQKILTVVGMGAEIDGEQVVELIKQYDKTGDGQICYDEFVDALLL